MATFRIGIDLDGVAYDFGAALKKFLVDHEGFDEALLGETKVWDFFLEWGLSLESYLDYYAKGVDAGVVLLHGDPHEGCRWFMNRLREDGHTLHIVTYRTVGRRATQNTMEWLQRESIPYDSITFSKDKTIVNNDFFIEDNLDNFHALNRAGIVCYLMDRPWNEIEDVYNRRVSGWEDFYWRINEHARHD